VTSAVVLEWQDGRASVRSARDGSTTGIDADALVIAETPVAVTGLGDALAVRGFSFEQVGDCVAPRRASLAFYEGRELALRL
jgi:hypothetical protein